MAAGDMLTGLMSTWPLTFAFAMISMFLAAFCSRRRVAALIATALVVISYFGSNLSGMVSSLEPLEPLFLHTYLNTAGSSLTEGQQTIDLLVLMVVGLAAFALALAFFQRRDITVSAWPWQRGKIEAGAAGSGS
jgi:ABC-type transport system involved in multi-copper enzyme maturation permease subunit